MIYSDCKSEQQQQQGEERVRKRFRLEHQQSDKRRHFEIALLSGKCAGLCCSLQVCPALKMGRWCAFKMNLVLAIHNSEGGSAPA